MKKLNVFIVMFLVFAYGISASTSLQFLKLGISARSCGMGEAFTAVANDASAIYWNPAGIIQSQKHQIIFNQAMLFSGVSYTNLGYSQRFGTDKAFGLAFSYLAAGTVEETTEEFKDGTGESLSVNNMRVSLAYSQSFSKRVFLGGSFKFMSETLGDISGSGMAFDFGLLFIVNNHINLGMVLQNIGTGVSYPNLTEELPKNLKLGIAFRLIKWKDNKLIGSIDLIKTIDEDLRYNVGFEYLLKNMIFLRAGYKGNLDEEGICAGLGVKLKMVQIDYSYSAMRYINDAHRFSLIIEY
ncbi:PorV/PorQ family protein [bacterium]|nr:PorV/PorQ family protein [bacterium]